MVSRTPAQSIKILLVEDSASDARLMMDVLLERRSSTSVYHVSSGEDAIAFLRHEGKYAKSPRPDMILLDLLMPGKSGLDVLKEIRGDKELERIPVVILSASKDDENVQEAYRLKANCYVTKGENLTDFVDAVKAIDMFWSNYVVPLPNA